MKDKPTETSGPKDAATSKGPNAKAHEAIALHTYYPKSAPGCKQKSGGKLDNEPCFAHSAWARGRVSTRKPGPNADCVGFRAPDGRTWAYRGKRARVVRMLVTMPEGVTQWDCWPWHTRLGGTIHALRQDGLEISTELEGEYRHARYRLASDGCLIEQAEDRVEPVNLHRETL